MEKLRRAVRGVDTFTKWQGYCLAPFMLTLIATVWIDIILRETGGVTMWAFDIEWFHYGLMLMLAMGYAVLRDQHVRVDLITTRFSPWTQAVLMALSYAVFIIPLMILVAIYGWDFAMHARDIGETTVTYWHAPLWPIKLFIFIGICLMLPQCFAELIRNIYFVVKRETL